jgi:tRNA threonylcarbamoyl adenosine modification protein (Sua5/YciO/YrdC/YwlC family)
MEYFKVNSNNPDKKILKRAADVIKAGGIIVYPTDTLYGLGVDINNKQAMDRLYYLKGRNVGKPVSILVNDLEQIEKIIGKLYKIEYTAAKLFFPGKMTLIFKSKDKLTVPRMSHLKKLGFRIPDTKITNMLIKCVGSPISTTSVNISSKKNVKNIEDILSIFGDKIDLILDIGLLDSLKGSSVLDLTTEPPTLLRKGEVSRTEIVSKLGYDISTKYSGKYLITFICSGNICRSPLGEGIFKKMISKTKYKNFVEINSAGTLNLSNSPAHITALKVGEKNNVGIHDHISKQIQAKIVRESNLIIAMALDHYAYLRNRFPAFKNKIVLLKQWQKSRILTNPSIADPIGHDEEYFANTFTEITNELKRISPYLLNNIKSFVLEKGILV